MAKNKKNTKSKIKPKLSSRNKISKKIRSKVISKNIRPKPSSKNIRSKPKPKSRSRKKISKKSNVKKTVSIIVLIAVIAVLAVIGGMKLSAIKKTSVIAFVNDEQITSEELNQGYDFLFFITGYPEEYKQIITKEAFLEQFINEKIILQKAAERGIDVSDVEVDEKIDDMMDQNLLSAEEFEMRLVDKGFSLEYFKNYYKSQLILSKFLDENVFSEIELTDSEIRSYYEANKDGFRAQEGEIRVRHILVETKEEADNVLKELRKGTDFAELAQGVSIGPSSLRGGDLGFFGEGTMVQEFEEAAFDLRIGGISDPVKTEYGWHIIKREHDILPYEETKETIKGLLSTEKQKDVFTVYIEELKAESRIIINLDGVEVSTAALINIDNTCRDNNGISTDTIIFYHADWCPHCQNMVSVIKDLEAEGYNFFWAETSDEEGDITRDCFSDVLQGGIPQFICAGTNDYELGEMSKSELRDFVERCRG